MSYIGITYKFPNKLSLYSVIPAVCVNLFGDAVAEVANMNNQICTSKRCLFELSAASASTRIHSLAKRFSGVGEGRDQHLQSSVAVVVGESGVTTRLADPTLPRSLTDGNSRTGSTPCGRRPSL